MKDGKYEMNVEQMNELMEGLDQQGYSIQILGLMGVCDQAKQLIYQKLLECEHNL